MRGERGMREGEGGKEVEVLLTVSAAESGGKIDFAICHLSSCVSEEMTLIVRTATTTCMVLSATCATSTSLVEC